MISPQATSSVTVIGDEKGEEKNEFKGEDLPLRSPHLRIPFQSHFSPNHATMNGSSHGHPRLPKRISDRETDLTATDLAVVNDIVDSYSKELQDYANQYYKGDAQWQTLAYDLLQKLTQLQLIFNNEELPSEARIAAVVQINHEFGKAIKSRINEDQKQLQQRSWSSLLLGKRSIKDILRKFKENESATLNILLMQYAPDYKNYKMKKTLGEVEDCIKELINDDPENQQLKNSHKSYLVLFNEFLSYHEPLLGKWYLAVDRIQKLIEKIAKTTPEASRARIIASNLRSTLDSIYPPTLLSRKPLQVEIPFANKLKVLKAPVQPLDEEKKILPPNSLRRVLKTTTQLEYFEQIYDLIEQMKQDLFAACKVHPNSELPDHIKKRFRELTAKLYVVEKGEETKLISEMQRYSLVHEVDKNARYPSLRSDVYIQQITQHDLRTRLWAIYDFCEFYKEIQLWSPESREGQAADMSEWIKKNYAVTQRMIEIVDDTKKILELAFKIDLDQRMYDGFLEEKKIYEAFLNEKAFTTINLITTEYIEQLQKYREQFWQGNSDWQLVAADLENSLIKYQKILNDTTEKTLFRLEAATEIANVFDYFIKARVGDDLYLLKEHTIVTEALQLFSESSSLRKISIKDIFYKYRQHHQPVLEVAIKRVSLRLSAQDYSTYVYQTNFQLIYDKVVMFISQLNEFIKLKQNRRDTQVVELARKLMDNLAAHADVLFKVNNDRSADIAQCIAETEACSRDFDGAIVAYMSHMYEAQLEPYRKLAAEDASSLIKVNLLHKLDEMKEELLFGDAKAKLIKVVRRVVEDIEPKYYNPHQFMDAVLNEVAQDEETFNLFYTYDERNSNVPVIQHNIADLVNRLTVIIDGIRVPVHLSKEEGSHWEATQLQEIKQQIELWIRDFHKEPEKLPAIQRVVAIFETYLAAYLFNLNVRYGAKVVTEEAIANFTSSQQKKPLVDSAMGILHRIDDLRLRMRAKQSIAEASDYYDKNHNEEILIRRFMLEYAEPTQDFSMFSRILFNFKRFIEFHIRGWLNIINVEFGAAQKQKSILDWEDRRTEVPVGDKPDGSVIQLLAETNHGEKGEGKFDADLSSLNHVISPKSRAGSVSQTDSPSLSPFSLSKSQDSPHRAPVTFPSANGHGFFPLAGDMSLPAPTVNGTRIPGSKHEYGSMLTTSVNKPGDDSKLLNPAFPPHHRRTPSRS